VIVLTSNGFLASHAMAALHLIGCRTTHADFWI